MTGDGSSPSGCRDGENTHRILNSLETTRKRLEVCPLLEASDPPWRRPNQYIFLYSIPIGRSYHPDGHTRKQGSERGAICSRLTPTMKPLLAPLSHVPEPLLVPFLSFLKRRGRNAKASTTEACGPATQGILLELLKKILIPRFSPKDFYLDD